MLIEYLINVALTGASYWVASLILFILGFVYRAKLGKDIWVGIKGIAIFFSIWGLIAGMASSANTYKNEVDYNRVQDQRQIESYRESLPEDEIVIVDRTRKPLDQAELRERTVDMRDRVEDSTPD